MTIDTIQRLYFDWLTHQVSGGQRYRPLLRLLHAKEFVWIVPNDDNRVAEGKELRRDFARENPDWDVSELWDIPWVSVLEVLVAISRRLEFQTSEPATFWAKRLIINLDLHELSGALTSAQEDYVDEVLDRLIWRQYKMSGEGGFFPLDTPRQDQTKLEIWFQLNEYIRERHP